MIQLYDYKTSNITNYSPKSIDGTVNIIAYNNNSVDKFNICDLRFFLVIDTFKRVLAYNKYKFFDTLIVNNKDYSNFELLNKFEISKCKNIIKKYEIDTNYFCDILIHNNSHTNYPIICDRKIYSNSIKNFNAISLDNLINDYNFDYYDIKFYLLQYHYSTEIIFDLYELQNSKNKLNELRNAIKLNKNVQTKFSIDDVAKLTYYSIKFTSFINNNLDIPKAINLLFTMLNEMPHSEDVYELIMHFDEVLGLNLCKLWKI